MTTDVHPSDVLVPKCLWAQRHDRIYLTIDVFDPKDVDIKLDAGFLNVRCTRSEDNAKLIRNKAISLLSSEPLSFFPSRE